MSKKFFKVIHNGRIVDAVQHPQYVRILANGQIILSSKVGADGIIGSDGVTIYISNRNAPSTDLPIVEFIAITENEYNFLVDYLNKADDLADKDIALVQLRQNKIAELSTQCQQQIFEGVTLKLSDNNEHNFKFTVEDQLNLLQLENLIHNGAESVIYHETGEPCKVFSKQDMLLILRAFRSHVTYHTTYFNVAKQYINSLTSVAEIDRVYYGMDLTFATESVLIRQLLITRGENA